MTNLAYRSDIDGLRAIAVLGVIGYHARFAAGETWLVSGGFIGVDVFFVISGYLISSIILRDFEAGTFSLSRFYERRARRILPALLLMMLASAPFALALMEPRALREYADSGLAALGFVSNVWFWRQDSYTAEPSAFKPLLHTWSLSVEEQFYLLYPVVMFMLWFLRRHFSVLFAVGLILSLLLANYGSRHFANGAFFLLPTRSWELLAGALLAAVEMQNPQKKPSTHMDSVLAAGGLITVVISLFYFDDNMRHPSFITVLPVAGTMLLIRFGNAPGLTNKLMSCRPLVTLGLLSYSLYLWHFPMLAFARIAGVDMTVVNTILLLVFAALLALASYHLVEKPARSPVQVTTRKLVFGLGGFSLLLAGLFFVLHWHARNELRSFKINESLFDISIEMEKRYDRAEDSCSPWKFQTCTGVEAGRMNILVVGDSLALDVINMLAPLYPDHHFVLSNLGGCPPAPDIGKLVGPDHPDLQQCIQLNEARFSSASIEGFDGVIIDNLMDWFTADALRPYLDFLSGAGMKNVFIIGNYLQLARDFPTIIEEQGARTFAYPVLEARGYSKKAPETEQLQRLAADYGYQVLDLASYACANDDCQLFAGDYPFSWDRFHLSVEFADYLGSLMRQDLADSWLGEPAAGDE